LLVKKVEAEKKMRSDEKKGNETNKKAESKKRTENKVALYALFDNLLTPPLRIESGTVIQFSNVGRVRLVKVPWSWFFNLSSFPHKHPL
jgi:hypothetical protein